MNVFHAHVSTSSCRGHDVRTIREMGWAGKNFMANFYRSCMSGAGFEVTLLTVDQNLRHVGR